MIDFHAHILPGMDDGSQDLAMTAAMLREESRQGVELVAATPHFYADRNSIGSFLERRALALEKVESLRGKGGRPLPAVVAGAEVCYFPGIGRARDVASLCVAGTKTILVEMPFAQWNGDMLRDIEALIEGQKLNVVLAHVERYAGFQKDRRVWDRVMALPLTPQINAGSFMKPRGLFRSDRRRRFCLDFLKEHPRLIVGSDCHNMESRPPNLGPALEEIAEALGAQALGGIENAVESALFQAG